MTIRVGIVGIGGFGREHALAFRRLGCEVAAVADVSSDLPSLAAEFGAAPYGDVAALLEHDGLQAVSVSLPPRHHPAAIAACVAKGLPVFCEKPVATSHAETERLLAGLGPGAGVAVGFCLREDPVYRRVREIVRSGEIGRVHLVRARKCWRAMRPWRLREGGGAVFVKDIHYFDLVPWLLDDRPVEVYAAGGNPYHGGPVEDAYQLLMRFRGGATFHLDSAWWTLEEGVNTFEVVGERARLIVDGPELAVTGAHPRVERPDGEAMVTAELRAFVAWVAHGGPAPPGLAEAVEASRWAQAVVDLVRPDGAGAASRPERRG